MPTTPGQPRIFKPKAAIQAEASAPASKPTSAAPDLRKAPRRRLPASDDLTDRLPPHSQEAERGVLGCLLTDPSNCLSICDGRIQGEDDFYDLRHQTIYTELQSMRSAGQTIDLITLQQRLKDRGILEQMGGIPYLIALQDAVPSAANLPAYLDILSDKATLRRLIQTCTEVANRVRDYDGDVNALLDEVERDILRVSRNRQSQIEQPPVKQLVQEAIQEMEHAFNNRGKLGGISTGLADLDNLTDGLHESEYIFVSAFPSVGKTALAMNIAEHVVLNEKQPVGVFSMEMTSRQLVKRFISSNARVNLRSLNTGDLAESDFARLLTTAGRVSAAAIHFDDTPGLSIQNLRARARRMWQAHGIKLFVIDYIQLMNATGGHRKVENRVQELADISGGLKALAKELNVCMLVLSQLTELQGGKTRLRGAAELGQDADGIWELEANESENPETCVQTDIHIRKQRNGPRNVTVPTNFLVQYTRFECCARGEEGQEGAPL